MREEALAQVEPHAFHRIEFGRGCRQRQKRDVVRHGKRRRDVPAGPVEEQDGVHTGCQLLREGGEEHRHGLGCRAWQGEGEGLLGARPAGGEEIDAVVALVGETRRAHAALVPTVAHPTLLTDPGLILAPELDLRLGVRRGDHGELGAKLLF
jgi:hypothetical protein